MSSSPKKEIVFHGIPASPGIAIGTVLVIGTHNQLSEIEDRSIDQDATELELAHLDRAIDKTRYEIKELQNRIQASLEEREASIFDAHLLILDDRVLMTEVRDAIKKRLKPADVAFHQIIQRYISALSKIPDPYIKERTDDIKDVASRIIANLHGMSRPVLDHLPGQRIIIAKDLTPSDTALLDRENVLGFAIEGGSKTSHTAILARSMKIPSIVGLQNIVEKLQNEDLVIVDGFIGTVIINPNQNTQNLYALKETRKEKFYTDLLKESKLQPETIDGYKIQIVGNIESPDDVEDAKRYGASGIGLFRTEYLYMNTSKLPSEDKQFAIYSKAAESMQGQPVIIRTLDVGGDKLAELLVSYHEPNPFLGLRAVRLCLERPQILQTQLRAILRASAHGNIKIMFPMLSTMEELEKLFQILEDVKLALRKEKLPFDENIEIGIMVEVPSAAILAEQFASNDLVQYTMAADRNNEKVSYLYKPSHPAVLRLISETVMSARKHGIWVSVCGEMGGDPRFTPLLIGLGVLELSMNAIQMGSIRRVIRRLTMHECEQLAAKALNAQTAEESLELSEAYLYRVAPDVINLAIKGV